MKRQELPHITLLWFIVCVSYGICFLHYEKYGDRWMQTYNTSTYKAYSIIFVIKRVIETAWDPGIFLDPFLPLVSLVMKHWQSTIDFLTQTT